MPMKSEMAIVQRFLNAAPVNVQGIIEALGIEYVETPMPHHQSGRIDKLQGDYWITVNSLESNQRRRFTAAHELAHYLLHRDLIDGDGHLDRLFNAGPTPNGRPTITPYHEIEANKMAAQILMPSELVKTELVWNHYDLGKAAAKLGVSQQALEIRLETLQLDLNSFREEVEQYRER